MNVELGCAWWHSCLAEDWHIWKVHDINTSVFTSHVGWLPERMEEGDEEEVRERVCGSRLIHSRCWHWVEPGYRKTRSIGLQRKRLSRVLPAADIKPLNGMKAEETMCYETSNKSMCWARPSEIYSGNVILFEDPAVTGTSCWQNIAFIYLYLEMWGRFLGFRVNFQEQCVGLTIKRSHFGGRRDGGYHSCRLVTNDDPWRQNSLAINSGLA